VSEAYIEAACAHYAASKGVFSYKLQGSITGAPDRLFLLPFGRVWPVEFKSERGRLSPRQKLVHRQLAEAGHTVAIIRSLDEFKKGLTIQLI